MRSRPHAVAEADVGFAPAAGAEVLAEGARLHQQGMFAQFGDPGGVVFARIMVDRLLDAAMDAQVACSSPSRPTGVTLSAPSRGDLAMPLREPGRVKGRARPVRRASRGRAGRGMGGFSKMQDSID